MTDTLTHDQLHALASRLVDEAGGKSAVAHRLGVSRQAVRMAINDPTSRTGTLIRIVEALHAPVEVRYRVGDEPA